MKPFSGIIPASVTPFKSDYSIDEKALANHVSYLASVEGVTGLLMNGHTGEILSLTREEKQRTIRIARETLGPSYPIMAGVHGQSTQETIDLVNDAEAAGADCAMIFSPFPFSRGAFSYPEVVVQFFQDIADNTRLPLFMMQYPAHSGMMMPPDTMLKIANMDKVIGVKEAVGDIVRYEQDWRMLSRLDKPITFLSASEGALYPTFAIGGDGAVIGIGNIPEVICRMYQAARDGNLEEAKRWNDVLYPLSKAIYSLPSFRWSTRLKYALYKMGKIPEPVVRKPLQPLTKQEADAIDEAIALYEKAGKEH